MGRHISSSLLSTYLAAAARQAGEGADLTDRSRWAIEQARCELEATRDVLSGEKFFIGSNASVGVGELAADETPSLAEIALRDDPQAMTDSDRNKREKRAVKRLEEVLTDLSVIEDSSSREDAAARLLQIFATEPRVAAA